MHRHSALFLSCRIGWVVTLITVGFSSCVFMPQPPRQVAYAPVLRIEKPLYATGFEIRHLADSSLEVVLFQPQTAHDTLQKFHWIPDSSATLASLSTTHIPYLKALGLLDRLTGIGYGERVIDPVVRERIQQGTTQSLTTGNELNHELALSLQPKLLYLYPTNGEQLAPLFEAGTACIQVTEYAEQHPLGRSEWIKLFGALSGKSAQAETIFMAIKERYQQALAMTAEVANRPKVMIGSFDQGFWYAPSSASFIARLIQDAGATYYYQDSLAQGNSVIPFERWWMEGMSCDYIGQILEHPTPVNETYFFEKDQRLKDWPCAQKHQLFACNTALRDYHGMALLQPDALLQDLIAIFHPELLPAWKALYFEKAAP
ncbi:MAG: ABC transporter substrate-binding protein [Flavobacteriales bacterium]